MSCAEVDIKICSICLSRGTEHYTLEKKFKSLLSSIAPEMETEISETSFTCCECLKKLVDLYYFKALYLDKEELVRNTVLQIGHKISIVQIQFPNCNLGDEYIVNICRICLNSVETDIFSTLSTEIENISLGDMIASAMPEVLIDLTYNPILCEQCTVKTVEMYLFNRKCMDTENKIKSYLENTGTTIGDVGKLRLLLNVVEHFKQTKDNRLIEYVCDSCEFKTYKGEDLKRHKLKKHQVKSSGTKKDKLETIPYKCTICSAFSTNKKNNLTKHMARHTKQSSQTFLCSTCDFQTNSKFELKKHTSDQHSEKDNSTFLCPKCTYTSNKRRNLSKHLARHRKKEKQADNAETYKCSSCNFDTKIKYDLTRHMLIHKKPSESIMYKCKFCPYQTNRKDNLSIHNIRHKCQEKASNDISEVEN